MKKSYILLPVCIVIIIMCFAFLGFDDAEVISEKIDVTTNDRFTWFNLNESTPGEDGVSMKVTIKNETYYFSSDISKKMGEYSHVYKQMYNYDPSSGLAVSNALEGDVFNIESPGSEPHSFLSFEMAVDKPFSFTYSTGNHVGYNTDAKVIDQIFDSNGNKL